MCSKHTSPHRPKSKISPTGPPGRWGPRMFRQQFMNECLSLWGVGEVWGIFPRDVGKIIDKSNHTYSTICICFGQQLNEQRCFSFQDYFSLCEFRICYILKLGNLWKSHMLDEEETVSNFDSKMKKKPCPIPLIVNKSTSNLHQAPTIIF